MAKGISVHVGVNKPDPRFQVAELRGCVNDAKAMSQLAIDHHFEQLGVFLDQGATFESVKQAVLKAAHELNEGDIFLFTFSGHGSTAPTAINEDDGQDETILLFDCILIDNYIRRNLWSQFKKGVRILGVADCCHAGSVLLAKSVLANPIQPITASLLAVSGAAASFGPAHSPQLVPDAVIEFAEAFIEGAAADERFREFTNDDRRNIIAASPEIHGRISNEVLSQKKTDLDANLLTLAACNDFEKALDGEANGAFTGAMLDVLKNSQPTNYDELMARIADNLVANNIQRQHPTRFPKNPQNASDLEFLGERPFTI